MAETVKTLQGQGGNALSGLLITNNHGFRVEDAEYIAQVNALKNLSAEELDDIQRFANENKNEKVDDLMRQAAWERLKANPLDKQALQNWGTMVALDYVDATSFAQGDVRARHFIPFKSTIDKLRGKGAPTPDQAFEFYSGAYQDVATRLGNPIIKIH